MAIIKWRNPVQMYSEQWIRWSRSKVLQRTRVKKSECTNGKSYKKWSSVVKWNGDESPEKAKEGCWKM